MPEKKEIVQAYEAHLAAQEGFFSSIAQKILKDGWELFKAEIIKLLDTFKVTLTGDIGKTVDAKLLALKTELGTKIETERSVLTQISSEQKKVMEENTKISKKETEAAIAQVKQESVQLQQKAVQEKQEAEHILSKLSQELEKFRIEHIASLEKDLRIMQEQLDGVGTLLKRKV